MLWSLPFWANSGTNRAGRGPETAGVSSNLLPRRQPGQKSGFGSPSPSALPLGKKNPKHQYVLEDTQLALRVLVDTRLTIIQQRALAKKVNGGLGCTRQRITSRQREVTLPFPQGW